MIDPSIVLENLLTPAVLLFALGFLARVAKSEMTFPSALSDGLAIYLLLAIGFKGGEMLRDGGEGFVLAALLTVCVGALTPVLVYLFISLFRDWGGLRAASMAAHFGSTSAVTFLAAKAFAEKNNMEVLGYEPALLAIMEVPAIVIGLVLGKRSLEKGGDPSFHEHYDGPKHSMFQVIYSVVTGKTILLLFGGMLIGAIAHPSSLTAVKPFLVEPFYGALALYLLDLGLVAGGALPHLIQRWRVLVPFGILAPLINGAAGVVLLSMFNFPPGTALLFGILNGSASYIAAPAAMRVAFPQADHGVALSASLGVTFPFNLAVGIPLLAALANALA